MTCPKCGIDVRDFEQRCPACYKDLGYPNVRAAQEVAEKTALAKRYRGALSDAGSRSATEVLTRFQAALRLSKAVICRSVSDVKKLISSDNELYANFYQLVGAGARRPEKGVTDKERLMAEDLLFPGYKDQILFAALSLDGVGVTDYGSCSMVLKNLAINERATVFEENCLDFSRRRKLGFGKPVPPGFRAVWQERDLLGCAKLSDRLDSSTPEKSFPAILKSGKDFVEVHIYGALHRGSLERIVLARPPKGFDKSLFSEIKRIAKKEEPSIIVEVKS